MSLDEIRARVRAELEHIPKREGEQQGEFRMLYNMVRMRSLGKNADVVATPAGVLEYCLASLRERYPALDVTYDTVFFASR
jgi:hypothetical protein